MAYGLKYFSEFADDQEIGYRVEIHQRDYSGEETEVTSSGNPFTLEVTEVDNIFSPIRTKKATIEWVATEDIAFEIKELDLSDDQKYKVFLYEIGASETLINKFTGYLVTTDCKEPFGSKPYPIQLSAACGLFFLRDYYFTSDGGEFVLDKINIKNTIGQCLQFANLELDFHTYVDLYDIQMGSGDPLALADFAADGLRGLTCYDALSGVLNAINAFVVQEGDVWVIQGIPDSAALVCPRRIYDYQSVFKSSDTPNRAVSIGREPFNGVIPNLIPTESVTTSLAETSSVVKATMSPGIAQNRLLNGQFAYPITGGNMYGWDINLSELQTTPNAIEPAGWQRTGFGTIDSPYKFEIRGFVGVKDDRVDTGVFERTHIDISEPIVIDAGLFNRGQKIKIIVGGAYRVRGVGGLYMELRLNDGDKDYTQWLDESGKWHAEKSLKNRKGIKIVANISTEKDSLTPAEELPVQTFEVKSEEINDYLERTVSGSQHAIANIYFRIFPAAFFLPKKPDKNNPLDKAPLLVLEDFYINVTTESVYEGAHTYVADADLPIRNANEVNYEQIVADKINIITPEQVRLVNRVMTGNMTVHNTDNLTYGWKRRIGGQPDPVDTVAWPIQYKVLKERIRQVCGKRIVVEGDFLGYDLNASNSVFLQYDDVYDNSKFYTITNWKWDVINRRYTVKLNELSLSKLSDSQEFIELDKEGSGSRGNRLYGNASGGSSSGNGSSSPDIPEPIELDPIDPLYFVVGKESTQSFDLGELIISGQVPADLASKFVYYPSWMLYPYEDRGEDGDLLTYTVTGTPIQKGHDQIIIEFVDPYGVDYLAVVPIIIEPETTNKNVIISDGEVVGKVPGFLELPDSWNFQTTIKGTHDKVEISVSGGGVDGSSYSGSITREPGLVEDGTYTVSNSPIVSDAGVYEYSVVSYRGLSETSREEGSFTLYDEEYLAKFSSEFIDSASGEILGVINPDGSSAFKQKTGWDIKSIVTDLNHDKITFTLKQDGVVVFNNSIDVVPSELEGEYLLFNELQTEYGSGEYELLVDLSLDDSAVYQRLVSFSIAEEEVKPEAGLKLIEFTANTTNYSVTEDLPLFNAQYDLPDNWGVLIPAVSVDYDFVEWELADSTTGALANINLENYTNYPQYLNYTSDEDKEDVLIFGLKSSLDIGNIHRAPSSFRAKAIFRLGGATGKIVAITQSDFSFRVPLEPGDYSGLRFITISQDDFTVTVVDDNMPKEGRSYLLPPLTDLWSVSARTYNGELFDEVKLELSKDGIWLHSNSIPDAVTIYTVDPPVNDVGNDLSAYIVGTLGSEGRTLKDPSNNPVLIDDYGDYVVRATFSLAGEELGVIESSFKLIDDEPEDIPIKDCCSGGDGELPDQDIEAGEYGGEDETIIQTVNQQGVITEIQSVKIQLPGVTYEDGDWVFNKAPNLLTQGSDPNSAATIEQVVSIAANGNNKLPVKTVSTSNITLSGLQTINGYTTIAGDRVLVQNQTNATQNGAYIASSGAWTRATDSDTGTELLAAAYFVEGGDATVIGTRWQVITPSVITIGTTPITIIKVQNAATDVRWISAPNLTDLDLGVSGGIHSWGNSTVGAPSNAGSLITFVGSSLTGNGTENNTYTNQILADVNQELFFRQRIFSYGSWTPMLKFWTTKHFTQTDINNWNSAYTFSQNFNALFDNRFDTRLATKTTTNLTEGTNLYFTEARVRATLLTGLSTTVSSVITSTDSVLSAFGKIQAQLNNVPLKSSTIITDANLIPDTGFYFGDAATLNSPAVFSVFIEAKRATGRRGQLAIDSYGGNGDMWVRSQGLGNVYSPWYKVVTTSNFNSYFDTQFATKSTTNLLEGTNLYFTEARVRATTLTGFSTGSGLITASDSVLSALGKAQGQINTLSTSSHLPVSIGTANGLSLATQTLSLGLATASVNGALSSADWTTFNSKQSALTGTGIVKSTAGVISYLTDNSANWNTAFSWGNHALAGYASSARTIIVGTGLIGGGNLTSNVAIAFDTAFGDARYLLASAKGNIIQGTGVTITGTLTNRLIGTGDITISAASNTVVANGTANFLPKFDSATTLSNSIVSQSGVQLRIGGNFTTNYGNTNRKVELFANTTSSYLNFLEPDYVAGWNFEHAGNELRVNRLFSGGYNFAFSFLPNGSLSINTNSVAPLVVYSSALVTNFNADLLDGLHAADFARSNRVILAGTGILGGGALTANVAIAFDVAWGDARYSLTSHTHTFASLTSKPTTVAGYGITDVYTTGGIDFLLSGRVPNGRAIAVNGTNGRITSSEGYQDLSANRIWTLDLATTGVGAGTYRSVTVDPFGRITAGTNPTTLAGYGITDAYSSGTVDFLLTSRVPTSRTITINGVTQDLTTNRSWTVDTNTYTAGMGIGLTGTEFFVNAGTGLIQDYDGLYVNFGQSSGQVAQGNDGRINNGQTAYNWGNHANQGYLTGITSPMVTNALTYTPIPNNRTITINGNTQYLNDNPNFTISSSGGNVTGSGTGNRIAKWTGGSNLGDSIISDNGSSVFISGVLNVDSSFTANGNSAFGGNSLNISSSTLNVSASSVFNSGVTFFGVVNVNGRLTIPNSSEAGLPSSPSEGTIQYVNSGTGKGLWCYMGSNGWRLMATRAWVGASNPGSSPP